MHLKRQQATTKLPIPRKGTAFIARALSNTENSVPVVIAIRDMLKLARTAGEVKKMIKEKLLKINGRPVKDYRESISLFSLFEADKNYILTLLPTGKFIFEESKDNLRLCKVVNKKLLKNNTIQVNLHDGSNLISKDKISVGDSIYLDLQGKIKKHIKLEKGKEAIVISGKYTGLKVKINSTEGKIVEILIEEDEKLTKLNDNQIIVK